jgi:hypothetical protein
MTRIRSVALPLALAVCLAGTAHADKKLLEAKPELARELAGCQVQVNGLAKIHASATELAKTAAPDDRAEIEREIEPLGKGLALEKEYCDEVAGIVAFIDANANAPYRAVERDFGERYQKVVKLRGAAKKMNEELSPVTRKLITRMARRPPPPDAPEPKRVPGKFPSGRAVELPSLPGTWRLSGTSTTDTADYSESPPKGPPITARATVRAFSGATCDQQRKALLVRGDAQDLADLDVPGAKDQGVAWGARYTRREQTTAHLVSVLCVPGKNGGLLATADVAPADRTTLAEELSKLLVRMLAAQKPQ